MSDDSRPGDDPGVAPAPKASFDEDKFRRKHMMIFGKDRTPDQIVAAIKAAHEDATMPTAIRRTP